MTVSKRLIRQASSWKPGINSRTAGAIAIRGFGQRYQQVFSIKIEWKDNILQQNAPFERRNSPHRELTFKQHVSKIASSCFYQLRRLRQLKRHTMKLLISAFILSRLDYCNVLLSELPMSTIRPRQRVQNAAKCRLALGLSPRDHVSAALKKLHWLPVGRTLALEISPGPTRVHNTSQHPLKLCRSRSHLI